MNTTLSIDEQLAERARKAASAMGTSLNQAVSDSLEQLAGAQQIDAERCSFEQSALSTPGKLNGWTFDRDEANRRA